MKTKTTIFILAICVHVGSVHSVAGQVPADVMQRLMAKAAQDHPNDYLTQEYVVEDQAKSYVKLLSVTSKLKSRQERIILLKAMADHPDDYSTQLYVVNEQLSSAARLSALDLIVNPPIVAYPDPLNFIGRMKAIGMHEEMTWRKSRAGEGWIGQLRFYNGKSGSKLSSTQATQSAELLNEVNCQLVGPEQGSVSEVRIEMEVYDLRQEKQTLVNGEHAIESLFFPCKMTKAFVAGKESKGKGWTILRKPHDTGTGYDITATIRLTRSIQDPDKYLAGAKRAAKQYVLKYCRTPAAANFHIEIEDAKYLQGARFIVTGFVDDQNHLGKLFEKHFKCTVRIDKSYWKGSSIKWTESKLTESGN